MKKINVDWPFDTIEARKGKERKEKEGKGTGKREEKKSSSRNDYGKQKGNIRRDMVLLLEQKGWQNEQGIKQVQKWDLGKRKKIEEIIIRQIGTHNLRRKLM